MTKLTRRPNDAPGNVIPFPEPVPRLRSDVPPFDPSNPAHLRAWAAMFDFGRASQKRNNSHE